MKFIFGKSKLHRKVLGTTLLVSVVPLLVFGLLSLYSLNYFHNQDVQTIEQTVLDQASLQISGSIGRITDSLNIQVAYSQISDIALADQKTLLEQYLLQNPELEEVSFMSLSESRHGEETSLLRRSGSNLIAATELQNQENSEKFKVASSGKIYISEIHHTIKGPMITLAVPVKNTPKLGDNLGPSPIMVVSGELRLQALEKIMRLTQLGNSGYVYLVDDKGFFVYSSFSSKQTDSRVTVHNSENISRYNSLWNEPVIGLTTRVSKLPLTLVVEWPANDADVLVSTVQFQIILALVLVLLLSIVLSFFLASRIVKPIRALEAGANLVAEGKFDKPVNIITGDELEQLGEAFNQMMVGLKRLEELKEEFVFIASHELRTPVTAIKGYLSMVLNGEAGVIEPETRKMLESVMGANQRLIQLVEDLLQVARSEAGRLTIEVTAIQVTETVESVIKELMPLASEKQIAVKYTKQDYPEAMADTARLKEVLVNLIGNAIKYTIGAGTVSITHDIKEDMLITHISDTGIGIDSAEQSKLFEKFYRVKNEQTSKIQGTGLGLFIVKQIVEKMGGTIWVDSEKGKGSTFSFSLQLKKSS